MLALIGAFVFCGAAVFAITVMVGMVREYRSLIIAALVGAPVGMDPVPTYAKVTHRRRGVGPSVIPHPFERGRAAA